MRSEVQSRRAFKRASSVLVGGVNSPVRSFSGVGKSYPLFIARAKGSKIYDVDGNKYIDYLCSWGASILGSANRKVVRSVCNASKKGLSFGAATNQEADFAKLIKRSVPSMELMRFVCSGTEATMSAIRLARAFTKRNKIVKFDGCYHGHADSFLVRAGSGLATFSVSDSAGVPESISKDTLVAPFNDDAEAQKLLEAHRNKVAAIILEPVAGNMGVVPPKKGFLSNLRKLANEYNVLLIFDETITGFRVARGSAQGLYQIKPDLTCLGKVIGGGMNVAGYGGRAEIMKLVAPLGPVYQAGTLSGNPVAVASGISTVEQLSSNLYSKLEKSSKALEEGLLREANACGVQIIVQRVGSMMGLFFSPGLSSIDNYDQVKKCSRTSYAKFFSSMLNLGVYLPPSPYETIFVSTAHTDSDIQTTIDSARIALRKSTR